ncbi:hypothetical protein Tco_0146608, partial [Tanacetum coccineum]
CVKLRINVPMEAWSMKGISALASSLAKKELKKEIEVVYKGSKNYEKFTKKIQVEYAWKPPFCDKCQVFGHDYKSCRFMEKETKGTNVEQNKKNKMSNVDRPFTEVQNRRVDYEKGKESKNYYKGNGFNGSFNNQRYSGNQNRFYNGRGNVGK